MKKINQSLFALSTLTLAMQAGAAGFALNESSAAAAGTAYAGRGSNAEDASIMAANPAGIALLKERQVTVGGAVAVPKGDFKGTSTNSITLPPPTGAVTTNGSSSNDEFLNTSLIPFGYFSMPVDDRLSFGFGIYAPFGSSTDYNDDWAGKYLADETQVTIVNFQPTVAYKFSDQLSLGLGVFATYGEGELSRFINPASPNDNVVIKGDDVAYGWNIGAIWQPQESTSLGISYRSSIKLKLKGHATGSGNLFLATSGSASVKEKAKLDITLPENIDISLTHQIDDRWTVMAGATWTRWSQFDKLVISSDEGAGTGPVSDPFPGSPAPGIITYVQENWTNTWAFALGASYKYSDQLTLKAGYALDQTPVKDDYRTARIPDGDRNWFTVGAKYELGNDWTVDAAYGYMFAGKVKIDERNYNDDGTPGSNFNLKGEYNNTAHLFSASVTKRF
ncbi:outer membrane protein transport protein [Thalassotalea sp. G20_0]|uniref:OmpP1/FadL family transporter n=1 Tax=Thalassotalea sp. G20_0 TaxID=2821093 RepID=UPI001ADCB9C6|nr:outer membrane protein transport protein [Thalassotalea sp. G20_0]MBO9496274.1 outer membrane protein transport protein [Thalassotalea sp. G20_0]